MNYKTDLVIVTNEPFPIGMAATNRIISYAKYLAIFKNVTVLIPAPTEDKYNLNNKFAYGELEKLKFEYTNKTTIWPFDKNKIIKMIIILVGLFNLIKKIIILKPKSIIIYSSLNYTRKTLLILRPILKFNIFAEENEYPKILKKTNQKIRIKNYLKFYSKCDGMIVMTKELKKYYKSINVRNIFHLPMTVDIARFNSVFLNFLNFEYFIYVGGGGGFERDGVVNIIESFSMFNELYPDIKLIIIGKLDNNKPLTNEIFLIIENKKIKENIIFLGAKRSEQIPNYLINSLGIVMAPQTNFESGGFPTKLGEFLASGRPVITTSVSEIPFYLNNKNSFLIEPGNNNSIFLAMKKIKENSIIADKIGIEGKKTAELHFNITTYKDNLIEFLKI
jgi:glycosyltransferase involved in cell wall biosynthesis